MKVPRSVPENCRLRRACVPVYRHTNAGEGIGFAGDRADVAARQKSSGAATLLCAGIPADLTEYAILDGMEKASLKRIADLAIALAVLMALLLPVQAGAATKNVSKTDFYTVSYPENWSARLSSIAANEIEIKADRAGGVVADLSFADLAEGRSRSDVDLMSREFRRSLKSVLQEKSPWLKSASKRGRVRIGIDGSPGIVERLSGKHNGKRETVLLIYVSRPNGVMVCILSGAARERKLWASFKEVLGSVEFPQTAPAI